MKRIRKAVIPAAGFGTRFLPETKAMPKEMLPIVDKPTIQYIVEEIKASGIEQILIISGHAKRAIEDHFDSSPELEQHLYESGKMDLLREVRQVASVKIHYTRQQYMRGLGDAILCAKDFIDGEPFGVILGDDVVYNASGEPALRQLMDQYEKTGSTVIGCQIVRRQNALFTRRCTLPKDAEVPPTAGVTGGHVPPRLLDEHLVLIGGLLHDIGTYRVFKHDGSDGEPLKFSKKRYILHGLKGYEYLLDEGVDESIAQFCRNHTGVGLTREDVVRQELPLPPADYVPMNLEQEVVMYADKFHSKSVPPKFLQVEAYTARAERFGGENKQRWLDLVAKYGVPDIPALAEKYGMRMI